MVKKITKSFFIAAILMTSPLIAFSAPEISDIPTTATCSDLGFEILGASQVIAGTNQEYSLKSESYTGSMSSVQFSLVRDGKLVERKMGDKYLRSFSQ